VAVAVAAAAAAAALSRESVAMGEPRILEGGISADASFGDDVTVVAPTRLDGCTLGDGVFVGPFVEIRRDVTVGPRTRIESHSFVCELTTLGADCVIAHGVMFINDRYTTGAPSADEDRRVPTRIGDRVSIGSNATMLPVSVCDDVVIGAGSVVTRDITRPGVYAGNPAKLLRPLQPT
jgi:acetyltransferase-like isoleucine patch superfamily enzyme